MFHIFHLATLALTCRINIWYLCHMLISMLWTICHAIQKNKIFLFYTYYLSKVLLNAWHDLLIWCLFVKTFVYFFSLGIWRIFNNNFIGEKQRGMASFKAEEKTIQLKKINQYILFKLSVKVINIIKIKSAHCPYFGNFY